MLSEVVLISEEFKISILVIGASLLYLAVAIWGSVVAHKNQSARESDRGLITFGWFAGIYAGIFALLLLVASFYGAGKWISTGEPPSPLVSTGIAFYGVGFSMLWARLRANVSMSRVVVER